MPKRVGTVPYRDSLLKALGNPADAAQYLNASLEDEDPRVFLLALRDVAEAHGGTGALAKSSQLNRENLYRTLSASGNPSLNSLAAVLSSLSLRLAVQSITPAGRRKPRVAEALSAAEPRRACGDVHEAGVARMKSQLIPFAGRGGPHSISRGS